MFKGLGNLAGLFKQAQQLGGQLQQVNEDLKNRRATGSAGGGLVTAEVNGLGEMLSLRLDQTVVNDRELIEDLVPAAVNQALAKAKEQHAEVLRSMTSGLNLPGLEAMFAQSMGGTEDPAPEQPG